MTTTRTQEDTKLKYQITNRRTGHDLGTYAAADEHAALDACARDAGYDDYADACKVTGEDYGPLMATEVSR